MNVVDLKNEKYVFTWSGVTKQEFMEILGVIKTIPGAAYNSSKKYWTAPHSSVLLSKIVDLHDQYGFVLTSDVSFKLNANAAVHNSLLDLSLGKVAEESNFGLKKELYPFQRQAVRYGILAGSHLNGDSPGLGKTPIAIGIVHYQNLYPCLVVTIKRYKIGWSRMWREWTDQNSVSVWTTQARGNAQVDVIHYDMLDKLADYIQSYRHYKAIIFDEIHYLANRKTKRTKAAKQIAASIPYRYGLSGSLVCNSIQDIYQELDAIGRAKLFHNEWTFLNRYAFKEVKQVFKRNAHGKPVPLRITTFTGVRNESQLYSTLRANCFIARKRREVMRDLPPLTIEYVHVEADPDEKIGQYKKELIALHGEMSHQQGLALQVSLQKAESNIFALRAAFGVAKLAAQKEWLMDFLQCKEKIIVFAYHKAVQYEVLSWLPTAAKLVGGQDEAAAQAEIDRFQNDDACQVIVCSISAAQEAVTLSAASYMAILEEVWTEKAVDQMIARMDRGDQRQPMTVYHLNDMTDGSVDKIIMCIRKQKTELGMINSTRYFIESLLRKFE